jgi:hypothetical protein
MNEKNNAEQIAWEAPAGVQMALRPEPGGSLHVEVANGVITITGKDCHHSQGEHAKKPKDVAHQVLAEVRMTIITDHCLVTWKAVVDEEKTKKSLTSDV